MSRISPHTEEPLWGPGIIWLMQLIIFHEKVFTLRMKKRRYIHSKATTEKKKKAQQSLWLLFSHLLFNPETLAYLLCTLRYPELTKGWFFLPFDPSENWALRSISTHCNFCEQGLSSLFPFEQRGNNPSFQQQFPRSYYMYLYLRNKESTSDMKL